MTSTTSPSVNRIWSSYQERAFSWFESGTGNAIIEAVAGSGKTTVLVEGFKRANVRRAIFVCYSKAVAQTLQSRVPSNVAAKTLHSVGFGAVMSAFPGVKLDDRKAQEHAQKHAESEVRGIPREECTARRQVASDICKVYGILKGTMTDVNDAAEVDSVLSQYGIEVEDNAKVISLLPAFDASMRAETSRITFDEMLSFVVDHDLKLSQYDLVACDEAQDCTLLQIELLKRLTKKGGRMVAVGDKNQAIFLFRGSDSESIERIAQAFDVPAHNRMPLSITYRCPRAVVKMAQDIIPHIQASENAEEGEVIMRAGKNKVLDATLEALVAGDMVLCRANAPLAGFALQLLREGRRACIKGRDIGRAVATLANQIVKKRNCTTVDALITAADDHGRRQGEKLRLQGKDAQAESLEDRCETIIAIAHGADMIVDVMDRIERLFADSTEGAVVFSSIHRSKGLEANTVVWMFPSVNDYLESKAKTQEARDQEQHLRYVAITRAMKKLIIQHKPKEGEEE